VKKRRDYSVRTPTSIRDWANREEFAHEANVEMKELQQELRYLGATAAAKAIAKARKSVQSAERHARRMVNDLRRKQLCAKEGRVIA
jgi:hypothetical protein